MEQLGESVLQSKDGRDVLNIIDSLRSQGISQYVDLPQIIVCGDQSSGKSSVLEAISGMAFPTKDALCTRFATELILRRSTNEGDQGLNPVSIIPGSDRSDEERQKLELFSRNLDDLEVGIVVEEAQKAMGLEGSDKVFCNDILRVEASSPDQPHLTLVDLPGLFLAGNKNQSVADSKLVETLVLSYMEQPRSIILAVVSAKSEFTLQQITQRAREVDPEGHRTLGLITKPDTLDVGSESERAYLDLAKNKDVNIRLGWHVVKNRDYNMRNATNAERDAAEKAFFSKGVWVSLGAGQVGVEKLRTRLSRLLQDQIMTQMPQVLRDIQSGISECETVLEKLGAARETTSDQRRYLLKLSQAFCTRIEASIKGDYTDRLYFGDSATTVGYGKRLRAQIQNTLSVFAESMRLKGHARSIVETVDTSSEDDANVSEKDESPSDETATQTSNPVKVTREQYIEEINDLLRRNRGCELPGTFNPLIVGEMFSAQCQPWEGIAREYIDVVLCSVRGTLSAVMKHVADDETAQRLTNNLLKPSGVELQRSVYQKLAELLKPHFKGHPITYNHYLTDNIQKAQLARHEKKVKEVLKGQNIDSSEPKQYQHALSGSEIYSAIMKATEPNMENYASTIAIDTMEAYYKVAMKKFIDDVSVLALEQCLIEKLPEVFSADFVCDCSDEEVRRLAGESPEMSLERTRATEKQKVLVEGSTQLTKLVRG